MKNKSSLSGVDLQIGLVALLAFLLPFKFLIPWIIAALLIITMISPGYFQRFKGFWKSAYFLPFCAYYLLHVLGLIYTENMKAGLFDLEVKFSLLVFPLIFFRSPILKEKKFFNWLTTGFLLGVFAGSIGCLGINLIEFILTGERNFFYTELSIFMHPSYFALYIGFAILLLLKRLFTDDDEKKFRWLHLALILFLVLMLTLLQSKSGLLFSVILLPLAALIEAYRSHRLKLLALIILACASLWFGVNKWWVTAENSRLYNASYNVTETAIAPETGESSQVRILVWKTALEMLSSGLIFRGTGTGDVNDEMQEQFKKRHMNYAMEHRLNAHNQYLQSTLALGILGGIALLIQLFLPLKQLWRTKNYTVGFFLLLIAANFLPESMLETQAGVTFYAFFYSVFLFRLEQENILPNQ